MNHGSQTIQQQGRIVQVGEETGISEGKHGQGEGCKMAKKPCKHCGSRWRKRGVCQCRGRKKKTKKPKDQCTCRHCATKFPPRYGEKNEYCSPKCHDEFRVMKWLPCSICMAKAGIGAPTAGKLLRIADSSIKRQWKRRGIKRDQRAGIKVGMLRVKVERGCAPDDVAQREALKHYENACMEDIKGHKNLPDWSSIAKKELRKIWEKKRGSQYSRMTLEGKAIHNQKWRNACPVKRAESKRRFKEKNKNCPEYKKKKSEYNRMYRIDNPEKFREMRRRASSNPRIRARKNLRSRLKELIRSAISGGTQTTRYFIGCSTSHLAAHLESQFKRNIRWDNYGTHWHVDHIIPVASFDHTDPKQVAQCWHWTNLRPLEANRNLAKGSKITEPQMSLML